MHKLRVFRIFRILRRHSLIRKIKMYSNQNRIKTSENIEYEEVINALNTLQSNAATIEAARKNTVNRRTREISKLEQTVKYLKRCGEDFESLEGRVIHVSGTKGKGSTCALCEAILRAHGYSTGFFSSPHLVAVRERIRINGQPLSPSAFTSYFWPVYNKLINNKDDESDMPAYFKFLLVMAYSVFLAEKVDVAVVEVGIGGEFDCTNFMKNTSVVGITSLGFDHTKLLGNTIESIAWQKAGIMKPGCEAFTASGQPSSAMTVLEQRALEKQCTLRVAPGLDLYDWSGLEFNPSDLSSPKAINTSLAIKLAHTWIKKQGGAVDMRKTVDGLRSVHWPGRFQILHKGEVTYYLDGAHTHESILLCAEWFKSRTPRSGVATALVFNATGGRDPESLLGPLLSLVFDHVYFCTNMVASDPPDLRSLAVGKGETEERCRLHSKVWSDLGGSGEIRVCTSTQAALTDLPPRADVLITGSLHLIGCVLTVLDPQLASS